MTATAATTPALPPPRGAGGRAQAMTTGGRAFMASAWLFISLLVYHTFSKVPRGVR